MRKKVRFVRLSLVITLNGSKKVVYINFMLNLLEDFLRMIVRGDSAAAMRCHDGRQS